MQFCAFEFEKKILKDSMFIASPMLEILPQIEIKLNWLPMTSFLIWKTFCQKTIQGVSENSLYSEERYIVVLPFSFVFFQVRRVINAASKLVSWSGWPSGGISRATTESIPFSLALDQGVDLLRRSATPTISSQ